MPQMSPIMWFSLFIMFSLIFILFNQVNFYSFKQKIMIEGTKKMMKYENLIWKW
uniref:ATP synthase complex subunit 8 n=1 Tax=Eucoptacra sp. OR509 TaxID=2480045 RepID=A0A3G2EZH5_9ORTH|nr:ATP synthase F0 subunit 8 [Eucoptacra sp. OR509]